MFVLVRHDGGLRGPDLANQRGVHRDRGQERHHEVHHHQVEALARLEILHRVKYIAKLYCQAQPQL